MIVAGSVMRSDPWEYDGNKKIYTIQSIKKAKTGLALIILGSIVTITAVIILGFSFCISAASYKKNIQSFLLVVNKNYKSRGIVWEFERQLVENYYKYYIIISFPRTIQRFENIEREVDHSQYYPPSSQQQTSNSNRFEPYSNSISQREVDHSQYYPPSPTPYSQNSYGPSSSSSSSPPPQKTTTIIKSLPPQLPYIYEQAQSVPLPQEILDMLELEERNAAKDI
ncbi:hypothetical protein ACTFIW_002752 [Dictyostelium discoideum]